MDDTTTPETLIPLLRKAGLTESQAKIYLALIENGASTPAELVKLTGETRTNTYMLCDKLVRLGLATKTDDKKASYNPTHPSAIEALAERRRKVLVRNEQEVKASLGHLIDYYYTKRDTPGVVTEVGRNAIESVYNNILANKQPLEYLRSPHDSGYMSSEYYREYGAKRAAAGIDTSVLSIATPRVLNRWSSEYDAGRRIVERTWLTDKQYNAKVEWSVYGNTVSALTFGEEPIALTIHSKDIAQSFREIFALIKQTGKPAKDETSTNP